MYILEGLPATSFIHILPHVWQHNFKAVHREKFCSKTRPIENISYNPSEFTHFHRYFDNDSLLIKILIDTHLKMKQFTRIEKRISNVSFLVLKVFRHIDESLTKRSYRHMWCVSCVGGVEIRAATNRK